jgi:hypothetical protein
MKQWRWAIVAVSILGGCTTETTRTNMPTVSLSPVDWTVGETSGRAAALTGDQAKAVLIARAYVDEQARKPETGTGLPGRQPQFIDFQPRQSADGWDVYVEFVGTWINDRPARSPGHSAVVRIDRRWKVFDYELTSGPPPASQPATSQPAQ